MIGSRTVDVSEVFARFNEFERENDLFKVRVAGVQIWPLIRFSVYSKMILPKLVPIGAAHPDFARSNMATTGIGLGRVKLMFREVWRRIREWVSNNPLLSFRRSDVLLALSPRITRIDGRRTVRLMIDFWLPRLKSSCTVLEFKETGNDYVPPISGSAAPVLYFGRMDYSVRRYRRSRQFKAFEGEIVGFSHKLSRMLSEAFGIEVRPAVIAKRVANAVSREKVMLPMLKKVLRRKSVKCIAVSVGYSQRNQVLSHAAHELGIPVVELQHGTIYRAHAAYNLPSQCPDYVPDWVLTWGSHWGTQISNYSIKGNVSVGYPYLQYFLERHPRKCPSSGLKNILFISQGTIGGQLSRAAVQLSRLLPADEFKIVYKLHPNESKSWRRIYPELLASSVEVVENTKSNVYVCFSEAYAVVGVYSTALLEADMWGICPYVLSWLPGAETMKVFSDAYLLRFVDSMDELAGKLMLDEGSREKNGYVREVFSSGNSADRIADFIDNVARGEIAL